LSTTASASVTADRNLAVAVLLANVRRIVGEQAEPSPEELAQVGQRLAELALRPELFPDAHFPAPVPGEQESLYLLGQSADLTHALYVWRPASGLATAVHDHSTWAVIAGVEGVEPHILWQRVDDGDEAGRCALQPSGQARIGPGQHIHFGPRDIHSVSIEGGQAVKHLHLYGRSLMDLPDRVDFDPLLGTWQVLTEKPVVLDPVQPKVQDGPVRF
jgi:predicted metal-dependent enzyme (double-stranded beta helix superfamily)